MSDFRSKLKEIIISSFGESDIFYSNKNSPINKLQSTLPLAKQIGNRVTHNHNKWRLDFSLENFKKTKNTNPVKVVTSMEKIDLFTSDKSQDRYKNLSRLEKNSSKVKIDLSTCLDSTLKIKNLKLSVQPKKLKNLMKDLSCSKEVTFTKKKGLIESSEYKTITSFCANHKSLEENKNKLNKTRDFSMNSTAIGSALGDHHNISHSKLIKEIHTYSDKLKSGLNICKERPVLLLNIPLYEMDQKSFLKFSPINVRKNYLITGARQKSMTMQSSSNFLNSSKKINENFSNFIFSNSNPKDLETSRMKSNPAKLREKNLFNIEIFEDLRKK